MPGYRLKSAELGTNGYKATRNTIHTRNSAATTCAYKQIEEEQALYAQTQLNREARRKKKRKRKKKK